MNQLHILRVLTQEIQTPHLANSDTEEVSHFNGHTIRCLKRHSWSLQNEIRKQEEYKKTIRNEHERIQVLRDRYIQLKEKTT